MKKSFTAGLLMLAWTTAVASNAQDLTEKVTHVLDQTRARQEQALRGQLDKPYPATGMWHDEDFALAAYWLNERNADADAGLIDFTTNGLYQDEIDKRNFHWHAYPLERIYFLFSSRSKYFPGRMSPKAEKAVLEMLWNWVAPNCRKDMAATDRVWWIWGSENHQTQAWVSFWGAAQIFKDHPDYRDRKYDDGTKPAEMAAAFDEYFKCYIREKASKGMMVEIASPTYAKYTLNAWYNIVDFAEDPLLKKRMSMLLDLYWAEWAIEQIDGVRGGSRIRCYAGPASLKESADEGMAWYHFGMGRLPADKHPGRMGSATTFWRPSPMVVELAIDQKGKGDFVYISRHLGLKLTQPEGTLVPNFEQDQFKEFYVPQGVYCLNPEGGALLRYTWSTPDFVMGMSQVESLTEDDWTAVSSQNHWNGVIFGGHPTARIFTQPLPPIKGSVYNAEWGVQKKGVMILQRLQASNAQGQRIWFDVSLTRVESNGWIFAEAPRAYAAVRIVNGGGSWQPDEKFPSQGKWLTLNDTFSPVIIETSSKTNFTDFASFQSVILNNNLSVTAQRIDYRSTFYATTLTLFTTQNSRPEVDGVPLEFSPVQAYNSPYIQGDFGAGVIKIQKDGEILPLDFNVQ